MSITKPRELNNNTGTIQITPVKWMKEDCSSPDFLAEADNRFSSS
jgi:hypothetical protein